MQRMMGGNKLIVKEYPDENYSVLFNKSTGFFARVEKKGFQEPFWSKVGPELLDISITNYCERYCKNCYRNSSKEGQHIDLLDYKRLIIEAKKINVFQVALGGGNPNQHPNFTDILEFTSTNGIVPSYTTNGDGLTEEILKATEKYCGAMAISAYEPYSFLEKKIFEIKKYNIKLNIHFVLDCKSIDIALNWLKNPPWFLTEINAIVFLNYKPVNAPKEFLLKLNKKVKSFFELIDNKKYPFKIGFDSCSISGIVKNMSINPMFYESCESSRFSAFISEDLKMYPCSFMINTNQYGDLKKNTIQEVWQKSIHFTSFRNLIMNNNCKSCNFESLCKGGCSFLPEINLCND